LVSFHREETKHTYVNMCFTSCIITIQRPDINYALKINKSQLRYAKPLVLEYQVTYYAV